MSYVKDLFHIPDYFGRRDFVLRLSESVTDSATNSGMDLGYYFAGFLKEQSMNLGQGAEGIDYSRIIGKTIV